MEKPVGVTLVLRFEKGQKCTLEDGTRNLIADLVGWLSFTPRVNSRESKSTHLCLAGNHRAKTDTPVSTVVPEAPKS